MVWNYHDDDTAQPDAQVAVNLAGLPASPGRMLLRHYRIDEHHSNAYAAWLPIAYAAWFKDEPQAPTPEQYAQLKAAGQLQMLDSPRWIENHAGSAEIDFTLPGQSISLLEISW
jgi:xylan 1,4-beta-xylosidase